MSIDPNLALLALGFLVGVPLALLLLIRVVKGLIQLAYTALVFGASAFVAYYLGTPEGSRLIPTSIDPRVVQALALIITPLLIFGTLGLLWAITRRAFRRPAPQEAAAAPNNPYTQPRAKQKHGDMPGYPPGYPPPPQQGYPQQGYPQQPTYPPPPPPQGYPPPQQPNYPPPPQQAYPPPSQPNYPPPQGYPQQPTYPPPPEQGYPPAQPPYSPPSEPTQRTTRPPAEPTQRNPRVDDR